MHVLVSLLRIINVIYHDQRFFSNIIWFYILVNMQFIFILRMNHIVYNFYSKKDKYVDIISLIRSKSAAIYIEGNMSLDLKQL